MPPATVNGVSTPSLSRFDMHDLRCGDRPPTSRSSRGRRSGTDRDRRNQNHGKRTPNQFPGSSGDNEWPHR